MDLDQPTNNENFTLPSLELEKRNSDGKALGAGLTCSVQNQEIKSEKSKKVINSSRFTLEPYLTPSKSPEKKKIKRGRKRLLEDLNTNIDKFAKFIVVSRTEGLSFTKVSPFLINKLISQELGTVKGISKMSNGSLLIEASSRAQSDKILKAETLGDFGVRAELHKTLNSSRGMITCFDFEHCSDQEILEDLKEQGVIAVRRFFRKKKSSNGTEEATEFTGSVMLTFDRPEIPPSVQAAFYKLRVRPYVPPPLRCFKCQKFGHSAVRCQAKDEICICGYPTHEPSPCPTPPKCPNCDGSHNSRSKDCPEYKIEKEIQKLRTEIKDMTFKQARVLVNSASYARRGTYSCALKNEDKGKNETKIDKTSPPKPNPISKPPPKPSSTPTPLLNIPSLNSLPTTSSTPMDENRVSRKQVSQKCTNEGVVLPLSPSILVANSLDNLTDDGGGPFTPVNEKKKKGRPKGKKRAPIKTSAESD